MSTKYLARRPRPHREKVDKLDNDGNVVGKRMRTVPNYEYWIEENEETVRENCADCDPYYAEIEYFEIDEGADGVDLVKVQHED